MSEGYKSEEELALDNNSISAIPADTDSTTEDPPDRWITMAVLRRRFKKHWNLVEPELDPETFPDDIKIYTPRQAGERYYVSPERILAIEEKLRETTRPAENWVSNKTLSDRLEHDYGTIRNLADSYRAEHPEWFRVYGGGYGSGKGHKLAT